MEDDTVQLDAKAVRLATELARLTGKTIEEVVIEALLQRLKRLDPTDPLVCAENFVPK